METGKIDNKTASAASEAGVSTRVAEETGSLDTPATPQVVVTDLMMPDESGLVAARHILDRHPEARVVFLSVVDTPAMIRASVLEGVHGYVVKEDAADELWVDDYLLQVRLSSTLLRERAYLQERLGEVRVV